MRLTMWQKDPAKTSVELIYNKTTLTRFTRLYTRFFKSSFNITFVTQKIYLINLIKTIDKQTTCNFYIFLFYI